MLLNNASTGAPISGPLEQLSTTHTPQSSSSPLSMGTAQGLGSQNFHHVSSLEMRGRTPVHTTEQGSIPTFAPTVLQDEENFQEADVLLNRFRTMTVYFPFVIIPPTVDARILSREKPFLFKAIMAAAEQNPTKQRDQVKEIMKYLALHIFELGEKNLDLLLGVLVHTAW
jgi:hypothetical protein